MRKLRAWPKRLALAYALFGLVLFGCSTLRPVMPDNSDNRFWKNIFTHSYPYASRAGFLVGVTIKHNTPLQDFTNAIFDKENTNPDYPRNTSIGYKFFSKTISPMSPFYWLLGIMIGSLFYYLLGWLFVLAIERWQRRSTPAQD
jgi:hypothetical protein